MTLKVGDFARWVTDVDQVYSAITKLLVGAIGEVLPPQEYYDASGKPYQTPEGFYDIRFPYNDTSIIVGQIPDSELIKVDRPE